jgi:myo-inositol-1(or 4)-monophosphatase
MTTYQIEQRCAEAVARAAGRQIQAAQRGGFVTHIKGRNDLVTDADRSVEQFVRAELALMFPQDRVFGEEFGEQGAAGARCWLVDPIDGTTNFAQGIPIYCISIGFQVAGETVVGVIYDPTRDELFSAQRGCGAWLDGVPMRVSDEPLLSNGVVVTGFPPVKEGDSFDQILKRLGHMIRASRAVRRFGSAALDLAYVACGRTDAFWEFRLNPWDTAAGYLMVQEAGGQVTDTQGGAFRVTAGGIVATNGHIHEAMMRTLEEATR